MKRIALALAAFAAVAGPASAAENLNCEKDFKAFWERMNSAGVKSLTGQQLADISRTATRGYDACTSGDERFNAKNFFDKISGTYGSKSKLEDLLREMDSHAGAKK